MSLVIINLFKQNNAMANIIQNGNHLRYQHTNNYIFKPNRIISIMFTHLLNDTDKGIKFKNEIIIKFSNKN